MFKMQLLDIVSFLACLAAVGATPTAWKQDPHKLTSQKADEYANEDCNEPAKWRHESKYLTDITMDDSTRSVYLAADFQYTWEAWSNKTDNGGQCTGESLGSVPDQECTNLDTMFNYQRIECVRCHKQA